MKALAAIKSIFIVLFAFPDAPNLGEQENLSKLIFGNQIIQINARISKNNDDSRENTIDSLFKENFEFQKSHILLFSKINVFFLNHYTFGEFFPEHPSRAPPIYV